MYTVTDVADILDILFPEFFWNIESYSWSGNSNIKLDLLDVEGNIFRYTIYFIFDRSSHPSKALSIIIKDILYQVLLIKKSNVYWGVKIKDGTFITTNSIKIPKLK